jgi:hypothetical protein
MRESFSQFRETGTGQEHRRSKPPRQSLRFMYRIELATLEKSEESASRDCRR